MNKLEGHEVLEEIKKRHSRDHPGGCRMFSEGEGCRCTLCLCDNLHELLDKSAECTQ